MAFFPHISAYADLADGDTPATPAAGGRHQAGHYTVTGGVHHHGHYRVRPFIVNLNHILSAHGNSNGYQLTVGDDRHVVPVSRSYVAKLRSFVG